jgi:type II secretory pathway component GspD/PulD (secretin)
MTKKYLVTVLSIGAIAAAAILFLSLDNSTHAAEPAFRGQDVVLTVSGSTGLEGVVMNGLSGNPVTDASGEYTAKVKFNWSGTVTPTKKGYKFEPASLPYTNIRTQQLNQNYKATLLTYTISGSVGIEGVTMVGLPGDPVSDKNGTYTATVKYGFVGKVTPAKEGYQFEPAGRQYDAVEADFKNHTYVASKIKFTIAGNAGAPGVKMVGLPGDPLTGQDGSYGVTVEYGWQGTITPKKDGYVFEPAERKYQALTAPQLDQAFTAKELTYTISGNTGTPQVVLKGLLGNVVSDANGAYTTTVKWGFTGTVSPQKEGFTFEPASITYTPVTADKGSQTYTAKPIMLTISVSTGVPGVVLNGLPGNPVSDDKGNCTIKVQYGWNGSIEPQKEGHTFTPQVQTILPVKADMTQNFSGALITFAITGSLGVGAATLEGLPTGPVTSDVSGAYTASIPYAWKGTLTPKKEGYAFLPAGNTYSDVMAAKSDENYTATLLKRTISGTIVSTKGPVEGVTVSTGIGGPSTQTDASGKYSLQVDYGWTGTIGVSKEGYTFEPPTTKYGTVKADLTGQGYKATLITFTISGRILIGDIPIEGVLVAADNAGTTAKTGADGKFTVTVPYGWTGTITPTKEGIEFVPHNKAYTNVTQSIVEGEEPGRTPTTDIGRPGGTTPPTKPVVEANETPIVRPIGPGTSVDANAPSGKTPAKIQDEQNKRDIAAMQQKLLELTQQVEKIQKKTPADANATKPVDPEQKNKLLDQIAALEAQLRILQGEKPLGTKLGSHGVLVSGMYVDMDIREILQDIARKAGTDIYLDDTIKTKKTTCQFSNVPVEEAIQIVLQGTTYASKEIPNSYLVFAPVTNTFLDTELFQALQDISTQVNIPIVTDEKVTGSVNIALDHVSLDTALDMLLAGTGYVVKKTPNYYLITVPDPKGAAFAQVSQTRRVKVTYVKADAAVQMLNEQFAQYAKADPATGTVLITAPPAMMERITSDLKEADRRPRHVLLDARVVVLERSDLLHLGVEWSWPHVSAGTFSSSAQGKGVATADYGGKWPWGVQIGYTPDATFTNALELTLNMLAENGDVTVLSTPQVLAQDGKEATISVKTEEYFFLTAKQETMFFYANSQMEKIESGTNLTITPTIMDNNEVTLDISVDVSDSVARARETDLPVVVRRTAKNTVRIKDGGTVALAGLTESRNNVTNKRTPGLSNLPLIGGLFNNTKDQQSSREIAVFVTAHLLPEDGELPTPDRLPGSPLDGKAAQMSDEQFRQSIKESLTRLGAQ